MKKVFNFHNKYRSGRKLHHNSKHYLDFATVCHLQYIQNDFIPKIYFFFQPNIPMLFWISQNTHTYMYFSTLFLPFWRSKYIYQSVVTKLCHKKSSSFSVLFLMGAADFYVSTLTAVVLQKKHYSRHQQEPCQFHLQDRYTQQIYYRVTHKRNCHLR